MPLYEHMFLARQDLAQGQVDALAEAATKIIEEGNGKVVKTETYHTKYKPTPHVICGVAPAPAGGGGTTGGGGAGGSSDPSPSPSPSTSG